MVQTVFIIINLILLAICILALILAGLRGSLTKGVEIQKIGPIFIAIIAFIVSFFIVGGVVKSLIIALIVMILAAILAILVTGTRGITKL